jgi:hypothetical protein
VFNPDEFIPQHISEKCNQVDTVATQSLSDYMLDVLAYCSLLHSPSTHTQATVMPLKERIINVSISVEYPPANGAPDVLDASFQLDQLKNKLEIFVEEERAKTIMSRLLASVEFTFDQRQGRKAFRDRKAAVQTCFPDAERELIAVLIIKKLDTQFQLHCDRPECGKSCRFYRVNCPNEGCTAMVSKVRLSWHDKECPYKIIQCECGDEFQRKETAVHKEQACKMRTVECPFKDIGCIKEVKAKDIDKHVVEDGPSHLLLAVNRMKEHEDVIKKMHFKVLELEGENQQLKEVMEKQQTDSKKEISKLESQLTKTNRELATLQKTCKNEFSQRQTLRD